jgi:hypothetical protein
VDSTPPVISNILVTNITVSGALVLWTTNELADSEMEYGVTSSYGSSAIGDATLVTSHSLSLSNLQSNTLYHFRVKSKDVAGNLVASTDQTFTTLSSADTVTIRGRIIDWFTKAPLANVSVTPFGSYSAAVTTNANGEFAVTATTGDVTPTSRKAWFTSKSCYLNLGNGFSLWRQGDPAKGYATDLGPQPENSLWVGVDPFDIESTWKYISDAGPEVNIGDFPIWPVASTLFISSDIPVKFWVRYPEEGRGTGNVNYLTSHSSAGSVPLEYNVRIELIDQSGKVYYSPYIKLGLAYGCQPITLTFQNGEFLWSTLGATPAP